MHMVWWLVSGIVCLSCGAPASDPRTAWSYADNRLSKLQMRRDEFRRGAPSSRSVSRKGRAPPCVASGSGSGGRARRCTVSEMTGENVRRVTANFTRPVMFRYTEAETDFTPDGHEIFDDIVSVLRSGSEHEVMVLDVQPLSEGGMSFRIQNEDSTHAHRIRYASVESLRRDIELREAREE